MHSQSMPEYVGRPKYGKRDAAWHIKSFLERFTVKFLLDISVLFITVNEVSSKNSQNFKNFDHFSRQNIHFQGVSSALEIKFQIPTLFKEFEDMHKLCSISYAFCQILMVSYSSFKGFIYLLLIASFIFLPCIETK